MAPPAPAGVAGEQLMCPLRPCPEGVVLRRSPIETWQEMVHWLKAKYPKAILIALNPPDQQLLHTDYNVEQNYPQAWLPIISRELANSADSAEHKVSANGA